MRTILHTFPGRMARLLPYAILTIGFWVFRLPLLLVTPFVRFDPDSFQYANVAYRMSLGQWPDFGFLPPLYPVFLYVTQRLGLTAFDVALLQMVVGYVAGMVLVHTAMRWSVWSGWLLSMLLFFYFGAFRSVWFQDMTLLTESLYSTSLLLIAAALLHAIRTDRRAAWVAVSILLSIPLLLRPHGIFIVAFLGVALVLQRLVSVRFYALALLGPFASLVLLMGIYGWAISGEAVPFRIFRMLGQQKVQHVSEHRLRVMLWEGVEPDSAVFVRSSSFSDSVRQSSGSMLQRLATRTQDYLNQPLTSGDVAYRGLVHGGVGEMAQLLPPFADKDSAYWLSQSCYPIPPPLVRYTVREYWQQGVPDFRAMRYRYEGTFKGALVNYMLQLSGTMHKVHGMVTTTLPFFLLAAVSWGLLLITGWRKHFKLHIALLLLAALLSLDALAVMAGAGRMLERYTFPPVFIAMVIFALSFGRLVSQCIGWSGRRRQQ